MRNGLASQVKIAVRKACNATHMVRAINMLADLTSSGSSTKCKHRL